MDVDVLWLLSLQPLLRAPASLSTNPKGGLLLPSTHETGLEGLPLSVGGSDRCATQEIAQKISINEPDETMPYLIAQRTIEVASNSAWAILETMDSYT